MIAFFFLGADRSLNGLALTVFYFTTNNPKSQAAF